MVSDFFRGDRTVDVSTFPNADIASLLLHSAVCRIDSNSQARDTSLKLVEFPIV
jgi:hypothetical protein